MAWAPRTNAIGLPRRSLHDTKTPVDLDEGLEVLQTKQTASRDSSQTIPTWWECWQQGMTASQAADTRGRTRWAALKAERREGFRFARESMKPRRKPPLRSNRYDRLKEYFEDNLTIRHIAALLGVTPTAILNAAKARNISRPRNRSRFKDL